MKRLSLEDEAGNVRIVPLQPGVLTIGRAPDNDLVLAERNVSRHHARIRCEDGRCLLEDAGSRYGIGGGQGKVLGAVEIRPGQVFQIGDFRLKMLPEDDALTEEPGPDDDVTPLATPVVQQAPAPRTLAGEPAEGDSLRKIQELEEFARQGWTSDFGLDEPAEKRQAGRYLIALLVLLVVAIGLGFAYYKISEEEPVLGAAPTTSSPPRPEPPPTQKAPEPVRETSREPAPATPPREGVGQAPDRPSAPQPDTAAPPRKAPPAPERPAPRAAEPATSRTPPAAPQQAAPAVAPAPADDAYARAKRRGDDCMGRGDSACAIKAFQEAYQLTSDTGKRQFLKRRIESLGGTIE